MGNGIRKAKWRGFRIEYLDSEIDWLDVFRELLRKIESPHEASDLTLLQNCGVRPKVETRRVWKASAKGTPIVLKMEKYHRRWEPDRWVRGLFINGFGLMRRIREARKKGFTVPAEMFLVAERREHGYLRERYFICEFIDGVPVFRHPERYGEIVDCVMRAHRFGICWGADPNLSNLMVDKAKNLRGIDMGVRRATWLNRGKDLDKLREQNFTLPRFFLCAFAAHIQLRVKNFLRKINPAKRDSCDCGEK